MLCQRDESCGVLRRPAASCGILRSSLQSSRTRPRRHSRNTQHPRRSRANKSLHYDDRDTPAKRYDPTYGVYAPLFKPEVHVGNFVPMPPDNASRINGQRWTPGGRSKMIRPARDSSAYIPRDADAIKRPARHCAPYSYLLRPISRILSRKSHDSTRRRTHDTTTRLQWPMECCQKTNAARLRLALRARTRPLYAYPHHSWRAFRIVRSSRKKPERGVQ